MRPQPNRFFNLTLVFLVALNLVPHFKAFTLPVLAVGGVCICWRLLYEFQYVALPNFLTKLGLVVSLFYLIFLNYGQLLGLEAGSAILICAVSLKLVDKVNYRDAMVILFLNFILLLSRFLHDQTLGITIFAAFDLVVTTALLVQLHNGQRVDFDINSLLRTGFRLFLQVAPIMVLLFFVFPRFSTGMIRSKPGAKKLKGFSDSLKPGSLSELAQADQPAFKVIFDTKVPAALDRYWRGGILKVNKEMQWEEGILSEAEASITPIIKSDIISYRILQEGMFDDWLFSLDRPIQLLQMNPNLQRVTKRREGDIFRMAKDYNLKFDYQAQSSRSIKDNLTQTDRKRYLLAPDNSDPRVTALVSEIKKDTVDAEVIANRLMRFYQGNFRYSLRPGKLKTTSIAEFVFEKKIGFCEHFAASFASLMRLAGVPSRIVIGFQGGKLNPLADYYAVTSKDAHAWTEIWSDKKTAWVRFDPTLMVSPLRLELGGDLYHSLSEAELLASSNSEDFLSQYQQGLLQKLGLAYDAASTRWNLFLLKYDREGQKDFFARLGFSQVNQKQLTLISLLILLVFFLWIRFNKRARKTPVPLAHQHYLELCERLAKLGVVKTSYEGPSDYLLRSQKELPEKRLVIEKFRRNYLASYYGNQVFQKEIVEELQQNGL